MLEVFSFEMLTGRRITPLPITTADWSVKVNSDETMGCDVPVDSAQALALAVNGSTALGRNGLLFVVDNLPVAAGPIWKRGYSASSATLTLTAGGLRSYLQRRFCLPAAARTVPLVDPVTLEPDPALDTVLTGLSLGTIAKRYIQQLQEWPGAALPIVLPADELGTRERSVAAVDLKTIRLLLDNLSNVINGPDIAFRPRFSADGLGIEWVMTTGSEAVPRLGNTDPTLTKWNVGAPTGAGAFDLEVSEDGTALAEEAWAVGGASSDEVIAARSRSTALSLAGFPLLQSSVTGLGDVTVQATAQEYADQAVELGRYGASFWSLSVRRDELGAAVLGDYWLGDLVTITVGESERFLPPGNYVRRIASIRGDAQNDSYSLVFAEAIA
jgi:hypothetical protein